MFARSDNTEVIRSELWAVLRHGRGRTGHAYTFVSAALILLSIAILPLEFIDALGAYHPALTVVEIILTAMFTVDYLLHLYSAPNKARYALSFFGIVDLLSILPFFLGLFGTQPLRLLRLVRLLRFAEFEPAASEADKEVAEAGFGIAEGEKVEHIISHHPVYLFFHAVPSLISTTFGIAVLLLFPNNPVSITVSVVLILFSLIFLWRAWLNFSYDVIYVTTHRLVFYDQFLLGRRINQINYHAITNVQPSYTNILGYFLGYGILTIETPATEQGRIELDVVRSHEKAAQLIMHKCMGDRRQGTYSPKMDSAGK